MSGFPTRVAHEQLAKVCEVIGIDPQLVSVSRLEIDADTGITVTIMICGTNGRKIRHGDDVLQAQVHIPISYDREPAGEQLDADTIARLKTSARHPN